MTRATVLSGLMAALALATVTPARAASISFNLSTQFVSTSSGDNTPTSTSTAPYVTMTFTDTGPAQVQLVVQASLETATEWVKSIVFNGSAASPGTCCSVLFTPAGSTGAFNAPTPASGFNNIGTNPPFGFDYWLIFASSGASSVVFDGTDSITYNLTCQNPSNCGSLSANWFNQVNSDPTPGVPASYSGWYAIAALGYAGTDTNGARYGDNSGTDNIAGAAVPEPSTLALVGSALLIAAARLRRAR